MTPIIAALPNNQPLADALEAKLGAERAKVTVRHFPDGEIYVRLDTPVANRNAIIVCSLDNPDTKILPLLFLSAALKDLGALNIGLIAPYLAYLRQDKRFHAGEGITSIYFARLLSQSLDWLVTVEPHLHRYASLNEIYSIPTSVVHAATPIARWIRHNITTPLLVGPDRESEQWVAAVANEAGAPYHILDKIRHGDREVEVSGPDLSQWRAHTPVLVDDIISTAHTMIETVKRLQRTGFPAPVCVGVHGVFADNAYRDLLAAGAVRIVTCNTIPHMSNAIDLSDLIASALSSVATTKPVA